MVYGIGNLIDIIINASDEDIARLGIHKGMMALIDEERREELLQMVEGRDVSSTPAADRVRTRSSPSHLWEEQRWRGSWATIFGARPSGAPFFCPPPPPPGGGGFDELPVCTDKQKTGSTIILISEDSERSMNTFLGRIARMKRPTSPKKRR